MDKSKEKVINVHIKDGKTIHFKGFTESPLCNNLNDPTMITNANKFSLNTYYYLSTVKKLRIFTDSEIERLQKLRKLQQCFYWPGTTNFKT